MNERVEGVLSGRRTPENSPNLPPSFFVADPTRLRSAAKLIGTPEFERAKRAFAPQLGRDGTASEILDRMGSCFAAIAHGCKAGRYDEAFNEVYWPRVERGNENFSSNKLGAHGAKLAATAQFFVEPFGKPAGRNDARPGGLSEARQALVLSIAGFALRAQGRLGDAVAPVRAGASLQAKMKDENNASSGHSNLSELLLTLGRVAEAGHAAESAVAHAGRFVQAAGSRQDIERAKFRRIGAAVGHADALAAAGRTVEAAARFDEAEVWQAERQPTLPLLYSLGGYQLCDLRLAQGRAREVVARAEYMLNSAKRAREASLLDIALATLSLGRAHAALASRDGVRPSGSDTITDRHPPGADELSRQGVRPGGSDTDTSAATRHLEDAVAKLRESGNMDDVPRGLIARAAWHRVCGAHALALDDLGKALDLAERSGMRLFHVDALIERARLALAMGDRKAASDHLLAACKIVGSTYFDESVSPPRRTDTGYAARNVDLHLLGAAICMTDDPAATAKALTEAARLVEAGYWGSLDELAELWARSGLPDGGTIARLTAARAAFDAEADAAFEAARNRGKSASR